MTAATLQGCPACGRHPIYYQAAESHVVRCPAVSECKSAPKVTCLSRTGAIEKWNGLKAQTSAGGKGARA